MVTARFKVSRVTEYARDDDGNLTSAEVEMTPDYANGRNEDWKQATPAGVIRMTVGNPAVLAQWTQAKALHIEFTDSPD